MRKKLETPVLFMVFNRPDLTQRIFDVIREAQPLKLYVAIDAPRSNVATDFELVEKVKKIVNNVDWPCETKYLIHDENLGCSLAGKTAWDWFFKQEDEMIFLEDDGLVSQSFFWYCQELLEKYRTDPRIAYIGGVNYGMKHGSSSYYFSRLPSATYSMATWKRVYDLYEYKMESYNQIKNKDFFKKNFLKKFQYIYFRERFDDYIKNGGNTYDIQMIYLSYKYDMYSIYPNINLSSNIGLDSDGANNKHKSTDKIVKLLGNRKKFELNIINHPNEFSIDVNFEKNFFFKRIFYTSKVFLLSTFRAYFPNVFHALRKIYIKLK